MTHRAQLALEEHAHRTDDGRWWFSSPLHPHAEATALAIVEACLLLDMPITDVLESRTWLRLVDKVAQLEERVTRLEAGA